MTSVQKTAGQQFWDANPCGGDWDDYREFAVWLRETEPYMFDTLSRHDWTGKRVLEVGCGQGAVLTSLPALGAAHAVGVDMSHNSLRRTQTGAIHVGCADAVSLSLADAERLPFRDDTFDAVISFGVLHHTPNTTSAIRELRRVLRPGGTAIVMLYHAATPKWCATRLCMLIATVVERVTGSPHTIANRLRARRRSNDVKGTALLEVFGVPTMQAFSNRESRGMFGDFREVRITNCQPGFARITDLVPPARVMSSLLRWLDRTTEHVWGFYQVIEARR